VHEDIERCVRAVRSRDPRFDGWFFTAVTTTGIYCRPSCPALTPRPENMRFYPSAAAAQQAGYRACKRCRPDASPGSPAWNHRADLVARAMRMLADGVLDREGVPGLAARLGYSARQVERQLRAELGAGPLALARAQRAQAARLLIETTALPMGEVAFAAGFATIRTFNQTVLDVFAVPPSVLRARARRRDDHGRLPDPAGAGAGARRPGETPALATIAVRLPFRTPLVPGSLFGHLAATAVPGVEEWRDGAYRRTLRLPHGPGVAALRPAADHVWCKLSLTDLRDLMAAISRCRALLDLDADPEAAAGQLRADPALRPLVDLAPGRRIPRTVDAAEFAIRAVLGQQVSVAAARTHGGRLAARYGEPVTDPDGGLTRLFPAMPEIAADGELPAGQAALALPGARRRTLTALARAIGAGAIDLSAGADWDAARTGLAAIAGIGPWTVEMIALRGLGDPDAFAPGDLGVRTAAAGLGLPVSPGALTSHAERWRPWRGYATQYLWATADHAINRLPAA
jgi:AraC family transcriptional regulator of adaptative response / DNA-3-methyladenine glycosylase II